MSNLACLKPLEIFFSRISGLIALNLGMYHPDLQYYKVYINDDPV